MNVKIINSYRIVKIYAGWEKSGSDSVRPTEA